MLVLFGWTSSIGAIALFAVFSAGVLGGLTKKSYSIDIESVPEELTKAGLPKEAIAGLLRDEIRRLIDVAYSIDAAHGSGLVLVTTDDAQGDKQPEITIAGTHFTAHAIAESLRDFFGWQSVKLSAVLAGDKNAGDGRSNSTSSHVAMLCDEAVARPASHPAGPSFWLILRSHDSRGTAPFCAKGSLKQLMRDAAFSALTEIDPIVASAYLLQVDGDANAKSVHARQALQVLTQARIFNMKQEKAASWLTRALRRDAIGIPASLLMEGHAYLNLGEEERAIESYNEANEEYTRRFHGSGNWEIAIDAEANVHLQRFIQCKCNQNELVSASKGFISVLKTSHGYDSSSYNLGQIWEHCARADIYKDNYKDVQAIRTACRSIDEDAVAANLIELRRTRDSSTRAGCDAGSANAKRFLDLALASYDGVVRSNPSFSIAYFNSAITRSFGVYNRQCIGMNAAEIEGLYREARRRFETFVGIQPKFYQAWQEWGVLNYGMYLVLTDAKQPKAERRAYLRSALEKYDAEVSVAGHEDDYLRASRARVQEALDNLQGDKS